MKLTDWLMVAFTVVMLALLFGLKINFKPFKIQVTDYLYGIGWLMTIIGISILMVDAGNKKYKKGLDKGADIIIEEINKAVKQVNEEKQKEVTL